MVQNGPSESGDVQQQKQEHMALEKSADIAKTIDLAEHAEDFKAIVERIIDEPRHPEETTMGTLVEQELTRRYLTLVAKRDRVTKVLLGVMSYASQNKKPTTLQTESIRRTIASYLDEKFVYDHVFEGTQPSGSSVPEYLARYIETREDEKFSIRVTELMLPLQYDVLRDEEKFNLPDASPRKIAPSSTEIAVSAVRKRLSYSVILQCFEEDGSLKTNDEPYIALLNATGLAPEEGTPAPEDVQAAKLLVGYIHKYKDSIKSYAEIEGKTTENLTVSNALDCCSPTAAMGEAMQEISYSLMTQTLPDTKVIVERLLSAKDIYPDRLVQIALKPIAQLPENPTEEERKEYQKNVKAALEFLTGFESQRATVKNVNEYTAHLKSEPKAIVEALCEKTKQPEMITMLLQASLVPKEGGDIQRTDLENNVASILSEALSNGDISIRDAFELYYLSESNSGGSVLIMGKVVSILEKQGHADVAIQFQMSRLSKLSNLATSAITDIDATLLEMGLTPDQQREAKNVALYLKESGLESAAKWWQRAWSWHTEFPITALAIDATILAGPALVVRSGWIKFRMDKLAEFADKNDQQLQKFADKHNIPIEKAEAARGQMKLLLNEYSRIKLRTNIKHALMGNVKPMFRGAAIRARGVEVIAAVKSNDVGKKMATILQKEKTSVKNAVERMGPYCDTEAELQATLVEAGYNQQEVEQTILKRKTELTQNSDQQLRSQVETLEQQQEDTLRQLDELRRMLEDRQDRQVSPEQQALEEGKLEAANDPNAPTGTATSSSADVAQHGNETKSDAKTDTDATTDGSSDVKGKGGRK